jgi:hypothetical protein
MIKISYGTLNFIYTFSLSTVPLPRYIELINMQFIQLDIQLLIILKHRIA